MLNDILNYLREHQEEMVADLTALVEIESPTDNKAAVDRCGEHLAALFREAGAAVERLPRSESGDIWRVTVGGGAAGDAAGNGAADGDGQLLVLGHLDTVFDIGDIARNPVRREGGRLYGPGVYDMKGGVIQFLWALKALRALGVKPARQIVGLLTSDEETGSHHSRAELEAEARRSVASLIIEPPMFPGGELKTWRKGVGVYNVKAIGRPAHAGVEPGKGVNAIVELAHHVLHVGTLADAAAGTTVNQGIISGGSRSNVVPEAAALEVDVRIMTAAEGERIDAAMRSLAPVLPDAKLTVTGGINRPPMERTEETGRLFAMAQRIGRELGLEIGESGTGGGSDGNFTSAIGCPTLDGLGAVGDGAHTYGEYVEIERMPERAALLAGLLLEL
jgi:glutamate carboxypeptidase